MDQDTRCSTWPLRRGLALLMATVMLSACGGGGGGDEAAAPTPSPSPSPSPSPAPTEDTTNLCENLVTDKAAHPMGTVTKPALLGSYTDPQFKTTIRRITDANAQFGASYAKPVYSTMPAWNVDETYLILYVPGSGHKLFNGKTYAFIRNLSISPADIEHVYWSGTDPDALYFPSGSTLRVYHPSSNTTETVKTFGSSVSFGGDPIYGDWASKVYGFQGGSSGILYNVDSGVQTNGAGSGTPRVSASGQLYVQGKNVYSVAGNTLQRTMTLDTGEHGAIGKLANGQDFWAATQFDLSGSRNGNLIVYNLTTGVETAVIGQSNGWGYPRTGTHVSAHAIKNPGWVAVSMTGNPSGQGYLDQEIALANVNTGVVCRVAHHRSYGQEGTIGYWAEPHVNISPSGTRMIYASDWNNGSTVDTYVVELPSYKP